MTVIHDQATAETIFGPEDDAIYADLDVEEHNKKSIYNVPGYAPVRHELSHAPVPVSGNLPADLEGIYLRNGTNRQFDKTRSHYHPFNGSAMLHQIQIKDGKVTYSNFYVRTPRHEFESKVGDEPFMAFSDLAGGGQAALKRLQQIEVKKQKRLIPSLSPYELVAGSTAVQLHHGKLYCLTEVGFPFELNSREVAGRIQFDGTGSIQTWDGALQSPFSAHPRIDPETGTFYNMSIDRMRGGVYYSRLENGKLVDHQLIHQQDLQAGTMAYLHDYIVTDNYVVFPDTSLRASRSRLAEHGSVYYFDKEYKMRWGVIPRFPKSGDAVRWFETERPGYIWHMVNGWERTSEDGKPQIELYAPMFDDYPSDIPIHSPKEPHAKLRKWILDLESGSVTLDKQLLDGAHERPSINVNFSGKPAQYAFLLDESSGYMGKGVLKYDLSQERALEYLDYGNYLGGEALFVPKKDGVTEDDGYLIDLLMKDDSADLVVIDARTMKELARIHLPSRVPFGVHACWLTDDQIGQLRHEKG